MWIIIYIWLFSVASAININGDRYNILIIHPVYSGSHHIVLRSFGDYLVSRGHSVTQIKFRQANTPLHVDSNVEVIDLEIRDGFFKSNVYEELSTEL